MANTMTADQLLLAVKRTGLPYHEMPGWRDRCRCHTGSHVRGVGRRTGYGYGPTLGVMWHHTAGRMLGGAEAVAYTNNILIKGNGSTVGPLSQLGIDKDGRIIIVAAGRCNHAGGISASARSALINGTLSLTGNHNLRGSGTDGNTLLVGIEILAPHAPNAAQIASGVAVTAEIHKINGTSGRATIGHGEASSSRDFTDPGTNMGAVRKSVIAKMGSKSPAPASQERDIKGNDQFVTTFGIKATVSAILNRAAWCYEQLMTKDGKNRIAQLEARIAKLEGK